MHHVLVLADLNQKGNEVEFEPKLKGVYARTHQDSDD